MQRKIDQGEPGMIRQSKAQRRLHVGRYYFDLDARLCWNRNRTTEQPQYPCLDLADVMEHDGWRIPQNLPGKNAPNRVSVRKDFAFNKMLIFSQIVTKYYTQDEILHLLVCREAPTFCGEKLSLHASMIFFKTKRHSRNIERNGWCEMMQSEVKEWLRTLCRKHYNNVKIYW